MINLLLCTEKMDLLVAFYKAAGLELEIEKHGAGPQHFSFKTNVCAEIYPPRLPRDAQFVLRIDVANLDLSMASIRENFNYDGLVVKDTQLLSSGKKAILNDPDGRVVELFQPNLG